MLNNKIRGFTLIEVMVVLAILGVLAAIALPSYQEHVKKTRRTDCQGVLTNFAIAMERHFAANGTYTGAATGGADTGTPAVTTFLSQCPIDGAIKYYNLTITQADATQFTLLATPLAAATGGGAQADDGVIELDSRGRRAWDKDNSGAFSAAERTWDQ